MVKNISRMSTPMTRVDFEERINLVREQLRLGKMHFARGLRGPDSLLQVRKLPNGRIDLLSIDESARLQANTMYQMMIRGFGAEIDALINASESDAEL